MFSLPEPLRDYSQRLSPALKASFRLFPILRMDVGLVLRRPVQTYMSGCHSSAYVRNTGAGPRASPPLRASAEGARGQVWPVSDVLISPHPRPPSFFFFSFLFFFLFEAIPQDPAWIDSARLCTHSTLYQPCDALNKKKKKKREKTPRTRLTDMRA